jgi:hypothetical protein
MRQSRGRRSRGASPKNSRKRSRSRSHSRGGSSRKPGSWAMAMKQAYAELGLKKFTPMNKSSALYRKTKEIHEGGGGGGRRARSRSRSRRRR